MPFTRSFENQNRVTDWTQEINEIPNQYGLLNSMNLFNSQGVGSTSVTFDRTEYNTKLLKQTVRGHRNATTGGDKSVDTFSVPLPFFKHEEFVTVDDVQNFRMPGQAASEDALGRVIADKLERARLRADQTHEYMKIQAIKGLTKDPEGNTLFDAYTEFQTDVGAGAGVQGSVDFLLGTSTTDVDGKIRQLKTLVAKNAKAGGRVGRIMVLTGPTFFDKLVAHSKIREAYFHYQNNGQQKMRDSLSKFEEWGIVDTFEHRGIMFMSYDATFDLPDGTQEDAFEDATAGDPLGEGFTLVNGVAGSYRGYWGPNDKLSGANSPGSENFAFEYRDQRDENHMIQIETSPLYFMAKPQFSIRAHTSN